jgi:hypothetical protein
MSDSGLFGDSVYESGDAVDDTDGLDPIEALTGDDPDELMQTSYIPPDREPHNLRDAPTEAEELAGESLDDKLAEEEPDLDPEDDPASDPDIGDSAYLDQDARAGRLVAPDEGAHADTERDEIAFDAGMAGYASSAEEAAVHVIDE